MGATYLLAAFSIFLCICAKSDGILFPGETWESGYIPVRGESNELFYVYFKSRDLNQSAPLIIWLNGGPGCSSLIGLFEENGPYVINYKTLEYKRNDYSWNNFADVVYVDQPVGVGFSIVKSTQDTCTNVTCVGSDFYTFVSVFLSLHPFLKHRPLYISGESYSGHYIPAIAATIQRRHNSDINLKGIIIGNPYTSVAKQIPGYPKFLWENSIINAIQFLFARVASFLCQTAHLFKVDFHVLDTLCSFGFGGLVKLPNWYDIRENKSYEEMDEKMVYMMNQDANQKELKVKKKTYYDCNVTIWSVFIEDVTTSLSYEVEYLLDNGLHTMLYFGDKDYVCNYRGGELLSDSFIWNGKQSFLKEIYQDWKVDSEVAGRIKKWKNFELLIMYNAGHMAPMNQPKNSLALIKSFIEKK